jgi:hypothetical protein
MMFGFNECADSLSTQRDDRCRRPVLVGEGSGMAAAGCYFKKDHMKGVAMTGERLWMVAGTHKARVEG